MYSPKNLPMMFFLAALTFAGGVAGAEAARDPYLHAPTDRMWRPVADDVYLQEAGRKIPTDGPVVSVAVRDGMLHAVVHGRVFVLENTALTPVPNAPSAVRRVQTPDGTLWALSDNGLYRMESDQWVRMDDRVYVDLTMHRGVVHGATKDNVYRYENGVMVCIEPEGGYLTTDITYIMEDGTQLLPQPVRFGPLQRIASYSETLYGLRPGELVLFDGKAIDREFIDWGVLPSPETRDMLRIGSRLYIATARGVAVLRGAALTALQGKDGLPYEDATCLARGFEDELWIGTTRGAIRQVGDQYHYFGAYHWLPADRVHDIVAGDSVVYIATDGGLAIIEYQPFTLQKKAAYYERHLEEWGHKRLGFTHKLYWADDELGWVREISDNDGGYTAHYLAAMCYKYAVTGDEAARREALDAFEAMVWLEEITPIRGFPARAIWSVVADKGHKSEHGSGGLPAKWYPTPDGLWEWKGDTSSDEVNAHFYAVSLFHDLAARGPEKDRAREHITRITDHIIENGWKLRDADGRPTRWGRWDPEYLLRPYGMYARGLNGMEAQTYAITALGLSGDSRYADALQQLLDWGYHHYTVRQKIVFPPGDVVPWDDRLAFMCYFPLFRYCRAFPNPDLHAIYMRSLERSWEVKRMQQVPWYNFIYGIVTGNDCEVAQAVAHLREWPLDLVSHSYTNSHRLDLGPQPGYVPYGGGTRAMSPRETEAKRSSRSALPYDGGSGGRAVTEPTGWLEDYWMGRYYGFIEAPTATDPKLITVSRRLREHLGAAPYDGPPRPPILGGR